MPITEEHARDFNERLAEALRNANQEVIRTGLVENCLVVKIPVNRVSLRLFFTNTAHLLQSLLGLWAGSQDGDFIFFYHSGDVIDFEAVKEGYHDLSIDAQA